MDFKHLVFGLGMAVPALFASCMNEKDIDLTPVKEKAQGSLVLNLTSDATFDSETRAVNEDSYKNTSDYNVKISHLDKDNDDDVLIECKASELSSYLPKTVVAGSYRIEASYGKEHAASRDEFLMFGRKDVTVKAKQETTVNLDCSPTCGKVSVAFDEEMATYYEDYSVSFGGTKALGANRFVWAKDDTAPWYIALIETKTAVINYTISLTAKEDYMHKDGTGATQTTGTATGSFELTRNKACKLTIKPNYTPSTDGGLNLTIEIDDTTNDKDITWEVPVAWI